jgi:hypothetical protein
MVEVIFIQSQKYLTLCPSSLMVSVEKSAVILMGLPFYAICFFSLTAFNIVSLFSMLVALMIICCGEFLFWSSLFGMLEASCT